jgi:hypothetical protein
MCYSFAYFFPSTRPFTPEPLLPRSPPRAPTKDKKVWSIPSDQKQQYEMVKLNYIQ